MIVSYLRNVKLIKFMKNHFQRGIFKIYLSTGNGAEYARREYFKRLFLYYTFLKETNMKFKISAKFVNACI